MPAAFAEQLYEQIRGFDEYGFPEAHAASFALLVYVSAWIKCHHPAAFACALLNSQPMGFYAPAQIVRDAREHGASVRGIDVSSSLWDCTLEPALRLGLRTIRGMPRADAEAIERARRPFTSFSDFVKRTGLKSGTLRKLARADAFRSLELDRRGALWQALPQGDELPLFDDVQTDEAPPPLPPTCESGHRFRSPARAARGAPRFRT